MSSWPSKNLEYWGYRCTVVSLFMLAIGLFTSITISALSHIFIIFPALYFTSINFKFKHLSRSWMTLFILILIIFFSIFSNWENIQNPVGKLFKVKYFLLALLGVFAYQSTFLNYLDDRMKKEILRVFLLLTTLATLSGIIALYSGFNFISWKIACHPNRACGLFGMYMTYGYGIGLFMILITGILIHRKKFSHLISMPFIVLVWIINLTGLILSYSRGAWVGFIVAIPFFFLKSRKSFYTSLAVMGFIIILLFSFSIKVQKTFFDNDRQQSNLRRISLWRAGLKAFHENPLLGKGFLNFEAESKNIKERYDLSLKKFGGHAHNNFIEYLASTGILGLLMLFLFHLFWFMEVYKRKDIVSNIVLPFVVALFVSGQFQYTLGDGENLFLIMIVWTLSQINQ